jgi:hypothetical protein
MPVMQTLSGASPQLKPLQSAHGGNVIKFSNLSQKKLNPGQISLDFSKYIL